MLFLHSLPYQNVFEVIFVFVIFANCVSSFGVPFLRRKYSYTYGIRIFLSVTRNFLRVQHRGMMTIIMRLIKADNKFQLRSLCACVDAQIAIYMYTCQKAMHGRWWWWRHIHARTHFCDADNDEKTDDDGNGNGNHATMTTTNWNETKFCGFVIGRREGARNVWTAACYVACDFQYSKTTTR